MTGSDQIALVLSGQAKHPHRSIRRAILRFERWDREGYLYSARQYTRRDVELLLPADLQTELATMMLASMKLRSLGGGTPSNVVASYVVASYVAQHHAFRRKHRSAYEKALGLWRAAQLAEWAIVFDYATQSGYRLTAKQRALQARVYEAAAKGVL